MSHAAPTTTALFQQGVAHHRAGRLTEAGLVYQQVLAGDPDHGDALFLLAGFDIHAGRLDAAVAKLLRATARYPDKASYQANLGEAYRRQHLYPEAVRALRKAITLLPGLAQPVYNLGLLLEEIGATEAALAYFEHAERLKPGLPEAARQIDELQKAKAVRNRKTPPAHRALSTDSLLWLANQIGATEHAIAACYRALEISPGLPEALNTLGVVLTMDSARVDEGIDRLREAFALDPGAPGVLGNLGCALGNTGQLDDAIATMRAAGTLAADPVSHSNLLFFLPFHPGSDARSILDEAREWDRRHARSVAREMRPHDNDRSPERRLRIGYVSPDFRNHCQSFFTLPLLGHHDRQQFEVFVYSSVRRPDALTARLVPHADYWRALVWADDAAAAEIIRADGIDILVDLTMHMADARPLLFARKPAPVQVCWLAYPGTTGLATMDYRLTDAYIDPPDGDASVYSERTIRLPDTFWCYDPLASGPPVGPLPARASGRITFACLNNFMKVNSEVLALWARVLRAVSGSRLVLSAPPGGARQRTARTFLEHGIASDRIEFVGRLPREAYLASHSRIDIGLDTFPYNGHTTSLDAWWMGVPVVTLVGNTVVGRAGLCQAMNLGMPELVATTPDEYVRIAVALCDDLDRLEALRSGLRARLEACPLTDGARFARNVEGAFRQMWRAWCAEASNR